eukprot:m.160384 g.160384  ORF g.160384 m.160384 type:complete len:59 (-) comp13383_c5_seq1:1216-1392(-)
MPSQDLNRTYKRLLQQMCGSGKITKTKRREKNYTEKKAVRRLHSLKKNSNSLSATNAS